MNDQMVHLVKNLEGTNKGNIFYEYKDEDLYIQNAVSFIVTAVKNGSHILLLENDRNIRLINRKLKDRLSEKEIECIHFTNNFDFYYANGNFHPQTILDYFSERVRALETKEISVCSWGLIEWRDEDDISQQIEEYEREVNKIIEEKGLLSVCAYAADRLSDSLRQALIRSHGVLLTDEEVFYLP
ncbi:MEDS domain-containing protein [Bacillus infantis]|uniref:MEDS domain-containing protein n=1 Tax=Bacillus infantis TaxID=324767 RepID=UPI001CD5B730|nr:MEDS domain-containing protein [Bacillus infantis]MCA1037460.1 MEDS domain-containing protein [Bacillus infantis]HER2025510.1 MEDS domain-containing protein [Streptococcus pyogenes]